MLWAVVLTFAAIGFFLVVALIFRISGVTIEGAFRIGRYENPPKRLNPKKDCLTRVNRTLL
jgi:hypothetical protein